MRNPLNMTRAAAIDLLTKVSSRCAQHDDRDGGDSRRAWLAGGPPNPPQGDARGRWEGGGEERLRRDRRDDRGDAADGGRRRGRMAGASEVRVPKP